MISILQLVKILEVCVQVLKEIWEGPLGELIKDFLKQQQQQNQQQSPQPQPQPPPQKKQPQKQ